MRAIIIERWAILRHGLRAVLGHAGHPVLKVAATAAEGLAAVRSVREPELVVVGNTDDRSIIDLVERLASDARGVKVLVLADHVDRDTIDHLLGAGVMGILGRLAEGDELLDAITRMGRGERVLSNEVIDVLVGGIEGRVAAGSASDSAAPSALTPREREILAWLGTGGTNRDIAARLFIGEATVKTHLASAYAKLGVRNRREAVARALELGLVAWSTSS